MTGYYWCLRHDEVEHGAVCRATSRLGPYETPEEARGWRERVEARNAEWEAADDRWDDDDDDWPAPPA